MPSLCRNSVSLDDRVDLSKLNQRLPMKPFILKAVLEERLKRGHIFGGGRCGNIPRLAVCANSGRPPLLERDQTLLGRDLDEVIQQISVHSHG